MRPATTSTATAAGRTTTRPARASGPASAQLGAPFRTVRISLAGEDADAAAQRGAPDQPDAPAAGHLHALVDVAAIGGGGDGLERLVGLRAQRAPLDRDGGSVAVRGGAHE